MPDLNKYRLAFSEDFNNLSLFDGDTGRWKSTFFYGDQTLGGNGERQFYIDPTQDGVGVTPYAVNDGVLTISAEPATAALKPQIDNLDYTSGLISSEPSFSMQYGYFEMRAQLPEGQGLWPAFWLLGADGEWPPELDVMEMLGNDPNKIYTTLHTESTGSHTSTGQYTEGIDSAGGFHTYGVDWGPEKVAWYIDGAKVFETDTPADFHQPMYMLANLAVGGYWPGNPDGTTPFPADMKIDYIRAYERPSDHAAVGIPSDWTQIPVTAFSQLDASGANAVDTWRHEMASGETKVQLSGDWSRYALGNDTDNFIGGSDAQYNELDGGKGNDVLSGNNGVDVFVVRNGDGNDTILDLNNTSGNSDKIRLDGFHFTHFDDVKPWLSQVGADTMLRLDEDQAVLLKNVDMNDLRSEQFVFVNSVAPPASAPPAGPQVPTPPAVPVTTAPPAEAPATPEAPPEATPPASSGSPPPDPAPDVEAGPSPAPAPESAPSEPATPQPTPPQPGPTAQAPDPDPAPASPTTSDPEPVASPPTDGEGPGKVHTAFDGFDWHMLGDVSEDGAFAFGGAFAGQRGLDLARDMLDLLDGLRQLEQFDRHDQRPDGGTDTGHCAGMAHLHVTIDIDLSFTHALL